MGSRVDPGADVVGVLWVAFDREKHGWHDKIAHTYVAYV
jgi:uncharacterized RDD family membrane protein YckC